MISWNFPGKITEAFGGDVKYVALLLIGGVGENVGESYFTTSNTIQDSSREFHPVTTSCIWIHLITCSYSSLVTDGTLNWSQANKPGEHYSIKRSFVSIDIGET